MAVVAYKANKGFKQGARGVRASPDTPRTLEHMLLHLPMHPDCEICQLAKISLTPARRTVSSERETVYGGRLYLLVLRVEATDYAF
eukprot:1025462-Pyramimonas_sp.AAC.1